MTHGISCASPARKVRSGEHIYEPAQAPRAKHITIAVIVIPLDILDVIISPSKIYNATRHRDLCQLDWTLEYKGDTDIIK
jgi:hypothetical protein